MQTTTGNSGAVAAPQRVAKATCECVVPWTDLLMYKYFSAR